MKITDKRNRPLFLFCFVVEKQLREVKNMFIML